MAQQVNLFSPLLLSRKQVFTARTMLVALTVFLVLVGAMAWLGVATLKSSSDATRHQLSDRAAEKQRLTQAIQGKSTADGSTRDQSSRDVEVLAGELRARRALLTELQQGQVVADNGHAARLRAIAQTIPTTAWVRELVFDGASATIVGATTSTASLNDWLNRLAAHPLMVEQQFSAVKVEKEGSGTPQRWTFSLSSQPRRAASAAAGERP